MSPFEQMWESSRHNGWSEPIPWLLQLGTIGLIIFAFLPHRWLRRLAYLTITLATVSAATQFSSLDIEEKWRIRFQYANDHQAELTEEELSAVTVDGANRLLGPIYFDTFPAIKRCTMVLVAILLAKLLLRALVVARRGEPQKNLISASELQCGPPSI